MIKNIFCLVICLIDIYLISLWIIAFEMYPTHQQRLEWYQPLTFGFGKNFLYSALMLLLNLAAIIMASRFNRPFPRIIFISVFIIFGVLTIWSHL